jgi:Cu+-exporting ATPase
MALSSLSVVTNANRLRGFHVRPSSSVSTANGTEPQVEVGAPQPAKTLDPVCGMTVDPETASEKFDYLGTNYYFCSKGCKESFDKEPGKFVGGTRTGRGSA